MKVLSVDGGLAFAICCGGKRCVDLVWNTDYRGELLIHACGEDQGMESYERYWQEDASWYNDMQSVARHNFGLVFAWYRGKIRTKAIIGKATVVDCVYSGEISRWMWVLESPSFLVKPISMKEPLGVWEYDLDTDTVEFLSYEDYRDGKTLGMRCEKSRGA